MIAEPRFGDRSARTLVWLGTSVFTIGTIAISWFHWVTFQFHTFDLAFYVQALWLMVHGKFFISLLNVPLMGNHAEPIVFLMAPIFAILPHPLTPVVLQNAALGLMAPIGFNISRRLGLAPMESCLLALALLVAPATGFVALHEFHPEAFTALFLLLVFDAQLRGSIVRFWICFLAALSCKENMALFMVAYCVVMAVKSRHQGWKHLTQWYIGPGLVALGWLLLYAAALGPMWNRGNVEYAALYSNLGSSSGDVLRNLFKHPTLLLGALARSLSDGNLVWALMLPFLFLPILRPAWLLIAGPLLLQHLLTWRTSEWSIYLHYGAPLIPPFWIATAEVAAFSTTRLRRWVPWAVLVACVVGQTWIGPGRLLLRESLISRWESRHAKEEFVSQALAKASVTAGLPYLSHLAMREKLYSLHHILKGLKTLSRSSYSPPPPTDYVLIDYADTATFDPAAGYYHPTMRTADGRIVSSSDRLLHEWLRQSSWQATSKNEITLYAQIEGRQQPSQSGTQAKFDEQTELASIRISNPEVSRNQPLILDLVWNFHNERTVFPWLYLKLSGPEVVWLNKGLCAPYGADGQFRERWQVTVPANPGVYIAEAVFVDEANLAWSQVHSPEPDAQKYVLAKIQLGRVSVHEAAP